ncbi:aldose epimerase family protein [Hydrogenophaga sp. PBL-H3]|uniref:aldose epimerase family protein n=1 Tax=Hydrogenophaga sp. PBL-H3 TaxID=434010 RepID=UPI0013200F88|nr:aldose epimerase family protein [Hydrogenophaga sp. PBL-H3]QHE75409.1 galactose mutarotase [Hydrogenophaga sp. PBL-H3]QHE79836.1 galactose mutarotase [Hydrogenophaga sp. PBL-H3]
MSPSAFPHLLDPARFEGAVDGRPTALFLLRNARGAVVAITNLGAKVLQIVVPDRHGVLDDVALGYGCLDDVLAGSPSMGAFVGRYAGRIGGARFTQGGTEHRLTPNAGAHCIHGGPRGARHRAFEARQIDAQTLELHHRFLTAEDDFPGTLDLRLTYRLSDDNALVIEHLATALDDPGPASFTSHIYFNLDGVNSEAQRIDGHVLQVPQAHTVLATGADGIATGGLVSLEGHVHDLRSARRLGDLPDIDLSYPLEHKATGAARLCAHLRSETSGRTLDVWTTEPLLQVYTAGQLGTAEQPDVGKRGVRHRPRSAVCLEPQWFPNAPNCPALPQNVVTPGQPYRATTVYRFGVN